MCGGLRGSVLLVLLVACGGGGSAGPPIGSRFIDAEAGGLFSVDFVTLSGFDGDARLAITEDGGFFISESPVASSDGFYMSGQITIDRDSFSGRGVQIAPAGFPDFVLDDGQTTRSLTVSIEGSVRENRREVDGTFTADALSGVGSLRARATPQQTQLHETRSTLSDVAGTYEDIRTGTLLNISIDDIGRMTGNNANCAISGRTSLIDAAYNIYDLAITVTNCAAFAEDDYAGYLTLDSDTGNPLLIVVADNGAESLINLLLDRL